MKLNQLEPRQALNKAFLKQKPNRSEIEIFKTNLSIMLSRMNDDESEEFHKNLLSDFLKDTYYKQHYFINTKGRNDLVIHNGNKASASVGVIIETKKPNNAAEMIRTDDINRKAFHELVLYYMRERITLNNLEVRHLIATNMNECFIFDSMVFDRLFAQNKAFVKKYIDFEEGRLSDNRTDYFYTQIAEPYIRNLTSEIEFTYFNINDYRKLLTKEPKHDDNKLIRLFKLLSPEHLLKLPFSNDSNTLDKAFYAELLHIMGLTEIKQGGKKLIDRHKAGSRDGASLIEEAINQLDALDKIYRLENASQYGVTKDERLFNVALELAITWINRILFLKLLEAQLIKYHKHGADAHLAQEMAFLNSKKLKNYDDVNTLFFQVLARRQNNRNKDVATAFKNIPYLNSTLFEPTKLEHNTLFISNLRDDKLMSIHSQTVLKDSNGRRISGSLPTLDYLFRFLDAYDFSSEGAEEIQEENKTLINASVLGLIFEKINGYKDGSFFTPGFITMYMSRETIRRAVVQKFNDTKNWTCKTLTDVYNKIDDIVEANKIVNSIKICDPAVGSGHFLVSALNEIIAVKNDLKILQDRDGMRLKEYHVVVENDELIITDDSSRLFEYNPYSTESQRVQEALFHEKQTIIENSLFGVDINPNSVKICRLRLWIELLKNAYYIKDTAMSSSEVPELQTLPNIDINIKIGNSLVSRFSLDSDLKQALRSSKWTIESYRIAVSTYRNAHNKEQKREMENLIATIKSDFKSEISQNDPRLKRLSKYRGELLNLTQQTSFFEMTKKEKNELDKKVKQLGNHISKLEKEVEEIKSNKIYENAFEWRFEFPEVLNDDGDFVGFDVVIGNPPYMLVFDTNLKEYLSIVSKEFRRNNDMYVAFIIHGFKILRKNALFSFITPNTFIKGSYFELLRIFLSEQKQITEIIDFGTKLIFDDANVFCAITSAVNSSPKYEWTLNSDINEIKGQIKPYTSEFIVKNSLIEKLDGFPKLFNFLEVKDVGFNYWTKGRGKVRGDSIGSRVLYNSSMKDVNDIPFIKGSDIQKYSISFSDNFLRHNWRTYLDDNDTFRFSQDIMEVMPKIVYRQTSNRLILALDESQRFNDKTVHIIVNKESFNFDLKSITALLNSKLIDYYFSFYKEEVGRAFAQVKTVDVKNLPFIEISIDEQSQLSILVDEILNIKQQNPTADTSKLETKIDQLVYQLYDLTDEEIEIIEESVK